MPNKLLPTIERPQPVSSAACASNILGDTPSCRPASSSSGRSCWMNGCTCAGVVPEAAGASLASEGDAAHPYVGESAPFEVTDPALPVVGVAAGLRPTRAKGRRPLYCQYGASAKPSAEAYAGEGEVCGFAACGTEAGVRSSAPPAAACCFASIERKIISANPSLSPDIAA